ncbi:cell division protein FtsQ/DivIB [Aliiglaciecola sp. CAU 1673]|uniref:cell division protein FtsQ/DivIB n=1 Tax=Aliiglaciecola sp. CAU 1673 TaxID=3032595 RepID=UPI0023DC8E47|nr:cell division protein FtsQ/DivIB [Aliiglaciecola sp. CAU 1673]MDF2178429.1 cell division protein FtsQ/DivIB [Aliiglaciecola sp. CAU 1673]
MMQASLPAPAKRPQLWAGFGFFVLVLVLLGMGLSSINAWLTDEQSLPVRQITVAGDFHYLDPVDVENAVRANQPGSFFELDVQKALADIEALPWVYRASIRKEWPNGLHVYVVEQSVVARWNDEMLLNAQGGAFTADLPLGLNDVPHLFGPQGSESAALQGYKAMQALLQQRQVRIAELVLSERFAWHLRLDNGLQLKLGRSEFIDRLQRFVDMYPLLQSSERQPAYVDLRYDTGLAVGWQEEQQERKS